MCCEAATVLLTFLCLICAAVRVETHLPQPFLCASITFVLFGSWSFALSFVWDLAVVPCAMPGRLWSFYALLAVLFVDDM